MLITTFISFGVYLILKNHVLENFELNLIEASILLIFSNILCILLSIILNLKVFKQMSEFVKNEL